MVYRNVIDYKCLIINVATVLFRFGERVKKCAVEPYKIMGHAAWHRYVLGTVPLETTLQEISCSFNTTPEQIAHIVIAMRADAALDYEVWTYLQQARKAERKLYGIITIPKQEYYAISRNHPFVHDLFNHLFHLSEFSIGSLTPDVFSGIKRVVQQAESEIIYIDRKLEPVNICSITGILPLYLGGYNHLLKLIMPRELIVAALKDYLRTEMPLAYNRTVTKNADTLEDTGLVTEHYTALWMWSLVPDILPDSVKDKLSHLGIGINKVNFFGDQREIERYYNLPFDIDTMSLYTSLMYENELMSEEAAKRILVEILGNANESGLLMVYFDKDRPRVDPIAILNCTYLAYVLNMNDDPVIRENEAFIEKILMNGGWIYGTTYFVSPMLFLLAIFRLVRKFSGRVRESYREGLKMALLRRVGAPATSLELGIRLLISQWLGISNPEDMHNLLLQRSDIPGFQWEPAPLYNGPTFGRYFFNPLFDATILKVVMENAV